MGNGQYEWRIRLHHINSGEISFYRTTDPITEQIESAIIKATEGHTN